MRSLIDGRTRVSTTLPLMVAVVLNFPPRAIRYINLTRTSPFFVRDLTRAASPDRFFPLGLPDWPGMNPLPVMPPSRRCWPVALTPGELFNSRLPAAADDLYTTGVGTALNALTDSTDDRSFPRRLVPRWFQYTGVNPLPRGHDREGDTRSCAWIGRGAFSWTGSRSDC